MAEAYARAKGFYNAQLTFINVANSKYKKCTCKLI